MDLRWIVSPLWVVIVLVACGGDPPPPPATADSSSSRRIAQGELVGFTSETGVHAWHGIPYARPPVGELRWRAPRPPEPWAGTLSALAHAPMCMQFAGPLGGDAPEGEPQGDEDCLYLNIYAPRRSPDELARGIEPLPVMVWIHGGGNTIGSADVYDGSTLARQQSVVVVTFNYRLGVFGWFSLPGLHPADASAVDRSGNYGTLDLIRALDWVRENIGAFGGDPSRVTLFGESAGGTDVYSLLLSPLAKGRFHRAIVESGGPTTAPLSKAENFVDDPEPGSSQSSKEVVLTLLQRDGLAKDRADAKVALAGLREGKLSDYLRAKSARDILDLYEGNRLGGMYRIPKLFRDGVVLSAEEPMEALRAGRYNQLPVMLGTNRDETKLFSLFGSPYVTSVFRIPLWLNDERRYDLENNYSTLMWKATGVDMPAQVMRGVQGPSVFAYRFDWDEEPKVGFADLSKLLGAAHALEIPFVFGRLTFPGAERFLFTDENRPAAEVLSDAMMSYWAQFAYSGDPGHGAEGRLTRWQPWDGRAPGSPTYMLLDTVSGGGLRMASDRATRESVISQIAEDERFETVEERCLIYADFVLRGENMSSSDYANALGGACPKLRPEADE